MGKSSKSIEAGGAFVRLFTEDSALRKGLTAAGKHLKTWGAGLSKVGGVVSGLGGSVATPLLAAVASYALAGDALSKASGRLGIDAESLSALNFAAQATGASVEDLESGFGSLRANIANAVSGSQGAIDAFRAIGLSVRDLRGLSPDQQFKLIANQLSRIPDPALKAAAANRVFGGSANKLLPLLSSGAAGIGMFEEQAKRLGATMSNEDASAAAKLARMMNALKTAVLGVANKAAAALAPLLTDLIGKAVNVAAAFGAWLSKNRDLVVSAFKIVAIVMAVGTAIAALGLAGMGLGVVFGGLSTIVGVIGAALSGVLTVLGLILSPIGALVAAIAGILIYSGLAGTALDWLKERFGTLATEALGVIGAIVNALSSGNLALAAEIAWTAIEIAWMNGVDAVNDAFLSIYDFAVDTWANMQAMLAAGWVKLESIFNLGVENITAYFAEQWHSVVSWVAKKFEDISAAAEKAWVWVQSLFDDSIDVDVEFARIDEKLAGLKSAHDESYTTDRAGREAASNARLAKIEQDRKATLGQVDSETERRRAAREAARAGRTTDSNSQLQALQDKLAAAIEQANSGTAGGGPGQGKTLADLLKEVQDQLAGAMAGAGGPTGMASKITSTGTFSASAVRGLSNTNFDSRIAAATEATAKATQRMANKEETPTA